MGICKSSCKNNKNEIKDISKTIKMFDDNQNKYVEVPVLIPATQNSLYSKRQTHSPQNNHVTYLSQ